MNRMLRTFLVALCFLSPCRGADLVDEVRSAFTYNGAPIHPGVIELFSNWISDPPEPQVLCVDLSTTQGSNRFDDHAYSHEKFGWLRTKRSDANDRSAFGYRFMGTLPSGTIVLHTGVDGGGSGTFESVMLLAVAAEPAVSDDGKPRTRIALRILRSKILGDRAHAVMHIEGTNVTIDRSNAHDEAQREPLVML
jgi:hypothetical protein